MELVIGAPLMQSMSAVQKGLVLAAVEYWLPAALIYLVLRIAKSGQFKLTRGEVIALLISNTALIVYVVARVYASTIPGGGAGYAVANLSVITALPALIACIVVISKIVIRELRLPTLDQPKRMSRLELGAVAAVGFGPVACVLAGLVVGERSPLQMAWAVKERMQQLCATAGEQLIHVPQGVEGIYLEVDGGDYYEGIRNGVFHGRGSSIIGEPLVKRGHLRYYETPVTRPSRVRTGSAKYERYDLVQQRQHVDELMSQFGLYRQKLSTDYDDSMGTEGHELHIRELSSGRTIAISRYFLNRKTGLICGHEGGGRISSEDFVRRALNLDNRFKAERPAFRQP